MICQFRSISKMYGFATYVPCLGCIAAETEASFVAAGHEDEPVLGCWCAGSRVDSESLPPVVPSDGMLDGSSGLCGALLGGSIDGC